MGCDRKEMLEIIKKLEEIYPELYIYMNNLESPEVIERWCFRNRHESFNRENVVVKLICIE